MTDTENFFGPLKQGYMWKARFCRVVHGCNKVMLGSMVLRKGGVCGHGSFCSSSSCARCVLSCPRLCKVRNTVNSTYTATSVKAVYQGLPCIAMGLSFGMHYQAQHYVCFALCHYGWLIFVNYVSCLLFLYVKGEYIYRLFLLCTLHHAKSIQLNSKIQVGWFYSLPRVEIHWRKVFYTLLWWTVLLLHGSPDEKIQMWISMLAYYS